MTIKAKLFSAFAFVLALVLFQGIVDWRHSLETQRDINRFNHELVGEFSQADLMKGVLATFEDHVNSAAPGSSLADKNRFRDTGETLLQQFRTNFLNAASSNRKELSSAEAENLADYPHYANENADLKQIGIAFTEVESAWNEFANSASDPNHSRRNALLSLIHDQLRPALADYNQLVEKEMVRQTQDIFTRSHRADHGLMVAIVLIALGALGVILFLARTVLQPLGQLTKAARDVASGQSNRRLTLDRDDEFGIMSRAFNEMLDTLQKTAISRDELEETVRQRTAELDRFFSTSADAMCIGDFNGGLIRVNHAFAALFGYSEEEFCSIPPRENVHPEDFPTLANALRRLAEGEAASAEFEVRGRTRSGNWRALSWKAVAASELKQIYASARDVTDLRRTTEALRQSEENLATTLNSIGDGVLTTDAKGRITRLNPVAEQLTGWTSREAVGRPVEEIFCIINEETRQPAVIPVAEVIQGGRIVDLANHTVLCSRDGTERPIADSCAPILDEQGKTIGAVLVFRDVTNEKIAAQKLRERETMLRQLANNLPSGATYRFIWNQNGSCRFQYISEAIERLTGLPAADILADSNKLFALVHEDDQSHMQSVGDEAQQNMVQFDCQTRIHTLTGELKWIHWRSLPHLMPDGATAWDGLIVDITPLKMAESELHRLNENLEAKVQERTAALRLSESHHRTLLSNLQGMAYRCYDLDEKMDFMSGGCRNLLGIEPEAFTSGRIAYRHLIHPDDQVPARQEITAALRDKRPFALEYRVKHASGEWRWVWEQGRLVVDSELGVPSIEGFVTDVTKRKLAEEALAEQQSRLSTVFRALPSGVGISKNRIITEVNERICEMCGRTAAELLNQSTRVFYHTDDDFEKGGRDLYNKVREQGIGSIESCWRRKNGQPFQVLITACAMDPSDPMLITFTVSDITDLKHAQERVHMLSQAIEQSPVAVMVTDTTGSIEYINPRLTELTGYDASDVIGKNPRILKSKHTSREEYARLWETITAGGQWQGQFLNKKKNGEQYWELSSISPIRNEHGVITHFVAVKEDITERREVLERNREQAALLDQTRDAILVVGLDGKIKYGNRSAHELYSHCVEKLTDQLAETVLFSNENVRCAQACKTAMDLGEWSEEIEERMPSGDARVIQSRWTMVRDGAGKSQAFLVVNSDITEKKQLEEQFLRAQRMESIGTLAAGVAHDLNNILSPILMSISILQSNSRNEDEQLLLTMLSDGVRRGAGIVRQLLTFGRGMEGERAELQPRVLLREMAKVITETFPKSVTLEEHIAKDLWAIHADATQIHQVILNLCVNARDAMPQGGKLTLSAENILLDEYYCQVDPEARQGPYVLLKVSDTGTGIDPKTLDKIFDPFFTTKERGKGTGLGLSTVLGIVKSHDGFIQVWTREGEGTQFKVYIPALQNGNLKASDQSVVTAPQGNGQCILIVDDEQAVRNVAARVLEKNGYRVLVAKNGAEGLVEYSQHRTDIKAVLTDMIMPVVDGSTLIRILREYSPDLRIIAMSGLAAQEEEALKSAHRADAFLDKPFTSTQLLVKINEILTRNS